MVGNVKNPLSSVKNKLGELKNSLWDDEKNAIINEFKEKGVEKIAELMEVMNNYTALFKEAGFEISSVNASIGLPPEISADFKFINSITEEQRKALLIKAEESKMVEITLKSLFKASDFSTNIKLGQFKLRNIRIVFGLIPGISISLS
jgi:hypothetical protein